MGEINFMYFDTMRNIKSSEITKKKPKSSDSKNARNFLNHKLDLFPFHLFWINLLVLAVGENNFRSSH